MTNTSSLTEYGKRIWSAFSQMLNVVFLLGHPNESISGRSYREPWPTAHKLINKMFWWQKDHCRSAYTNDLKWAQEYLAQDHEAGKDGPR